MDLAPPRAWGNVTRYLLLVLEDCCRLIWPGDGSVTGFKPKAGEGAEAVGIGGRKLKTPASKKRSAASSAGAGGTKSTKRAPQTCKVCGQIRKGHTCPGPPPV